MAVNLQELVNDINYFNLHALTHKARVHRVPNLAIFLVVLLVLLCSRWSKFVFDLNISCCVLPSNQCELSAYNDYKTINGRERVDGFESKLHELVDPPWIPMCLHVCVSLSLCVHMCAHVCVFVCVCT